MKQYFFIIVFPICLITIDAHTAGGVNGVGNGGDSIFCKANSENMLNGTYSLDYILTLNEKNQDLDSQAVASWESSAERIHQILRTKLPAFADSFNEYRHLAFNSKNLSEKRIWEAAAFGLLDIKDEVITSQVPANCKNSGEVKVNQTVIRQFESFVGTNKQIVYKYVPELIQELNAKSPLQLSYLMIHEWLWDISTNVQRNRRINKFLHSKQIDTMNSEDITAYLQSMGLQIPGQDVKVFSANSCQGTKLTLADIQNQKDGLNILGTIKHFTRRRMHLDNRPTTEQDWLQEDPNKDRFNDYKFFTYTIKKSDAFDPWVVHIYSPNWPHTSSWRIAGQINCKLTDDDDYNLHCVHNEDLPVVLKELRGVLTDECVRLESRYTDKQSIEEIPHIHNSYFYEFQNVLYMEYRWKR